MSFFFLPIVLFCSAQKILVPIILTPHDWQTWSLACIITFCFPNDSLKSSNAEKSYCFHYHEIALYRKSLHLCCTCANTEIWLGCKIPAYCAEVNWSIISLIKTRVAILYIYWWHTHLGRVGWHGWYTWLPKCVVVIYLTSPCLKFLDWPDHNNRMGEEDKRHVPTPNSSPRTSAHKTNMFLCLLWILCQKKAQVWN